MLVIEVTGLAPGQFDVLAVSGDVTLNGTLEVRFLDGFLPKQGDHVDFLQPAARSAAISRRSPFRNWPLASTRT